MKVLWAPWRLRYIEQARSPKECIFCEKSREKRDFENFILSRGKTSFTMLNVFPYTNGHLMVAPYRHTADFDDLSNQEATELLRGLGQAIKLLKGSLKPEGFNIGLNLGKVAGTGVEGHLHFHVVPRWEGDSNFMPVIGDVKVIPEHIEATYRKLKRELRTVKGSKRSKSEREPQTIPRRGSRGLS